jgi:hypothetical protein
MTWEEVRKIYPNQFVKIEILKYHIEADYEILDDVAIIEPVSKKDATKELLNSKENNLVYHTSKKSIILELRNRIDFRRAFKEKKMN